MGLGKLNQYRFRRFQLGGKKIYVVGVILLTVVVLIWTIIDLADLATR